MSHAIKKPHGANMFHCDKNTLNFEGDNKYRILKLMIGALFTLHVPQVSGERYLKAESECT
jgi:hypothetical protein